MVKKDNTAVDTAKFESLAKKLASTVGENDTTQGVKAWLSTGFLPLNAAISGMFDGGLPQQRIIEIFGPESSGKTFVATCAMIAAQRAGGIACFHDHERSFDLELAMSIGLDDMFPKWIFKTPMSYEESIATFIGVVKTIRESKAISDDAPIVYVFDSLASMTPKQVFEKNFAALNMNDTTALARLTSSTFPAIAQIAERYNVTVIFLNQIRMKPGVVYGDPTTTPGGNAPKYYSSVRIQLGASRIMKEVDGDKVMIGSKVTARCIKNKVNRPFLKAEWSFMFRDDGTGYFDVVGSTLDFATAKGLVKTEGEKQGKRWIWDGAKYHRNALVKKIEDEGLLPQLEKLLLDSDVEVDHEAPAPLEDDELTDE